MTYFLVVSPRETWAKWSKTDTGFMGFPRGKNDRILKKAQKIEVGDCLLCYCTSPDMTFIGVYCVETTAFVDTTIRYDGDIYPVRFRVRCLYWLGLEKGISINDLRNKVPAWKNKNNLGNYFHPSLRTYDYNTGQIIVDAIRTQISL